MTRPAFGALLATVAMALIALAFAGAFSPLADELFDARIVPDGSEAKVVAVFANAPLRVGDRIMLSEMTTSRRLRLRVGSGPPGTTLVLPVERDGRRTTARVGFSYRAPTPAGRILNLTLLGLAVVTLLVVGIVAWRRPSLGTAALIVFGSGSMTAGSLGMLATPFPDPIFLPLALLCSLVVTPALFALIPFLARFPAEPTTPRGIWLRRIGDLLFLASVVWGFLQFVFEPLIFATWTVVAALQPYVSLVIIGYALVAYFAAAGEDRRRIGWVIGGCVVSTVAETLFNVFGARVGTDPGPSIAFSILELALPVALAYAVLRHRVLDIGFAVNRTLIYGVLVAVVVALVSVVDWAAAKVMGGERLSGAVEIVLTIAIGFALNALHRTIESFVDRTIFRQRHLAERRIASRGEALAYVEDDRPIDEALAGDVASILGLASAATFRRVDEGRFARVAAAGWEHAAVGIERDALLVRTLRARAAPFFLQDEAIVVADAPLGLARPTLAVPVMVQHDLIAFALYGDHGDGSSLDPDEIASLRGLARSAGVAYASSEARRWRERALSLAPAGIA